MPNCTYTRLSYSHATIPRTAMHTVGHDELFCYPSESAWSSKWHVWFASRCPGRRLSTRKMIAASCPTALGARCGQLTFRLAWCRGQSAVTATELLQPLNLARGTLFRSSCAIQTSPTDCSDDSWSDAYFGKHECGALWLLIYGALQKRLLTYLLTTISSQLSPLTLSSTPLDSEWLSFFTWFRLVHSKTTTMTICL